MCNNINSVKKSKYLLSIGHLVQSGNDHQQRLKVDDERLQFSLRCCQRSNNRPANIVALMACNGSTRKAKPPLVYVVKALLLHLPYVTIANPFCRIVSILYFYLDCVLHYYHDFCDTQRSVENCSLSDTQINISSKWKVSACTAL